MSRRKNRTSQPSPNHSVSASVRTEMTAAEYRFAGPIPPPTVLRQYNEITPGLAERILQMAERNQGHRIELDLRMLNAEIEDAKEARRIQRRGQICGLVIALTTVVSGAIVAWHGQQWAGSFIGVAGLTGLVTVFVKTHQPPSQEGKAK